MKKCILIAIMACIFSACASFELTRSYKRGQSVELGEVVSATIGEVIFSSYDYIIVPIARPSRNIQGGTWSGRPYVPKGTSLIGGISNGIETFCTNHQGYNAAFQDCDQDGRFEVAYMKNALGQLVNKTIFDEPVAYSKGEIPQNAGGFKYELLYQGISDKVLNITYREFSNNLARPAFQQDLKYTLNNNSPTEIAFRSVKIKVYSADNQSIRYEVLSGFNY